MVLFILVELFAYLCAMSIIFSIASDLDGE